MKKTKRPMTAVEMGRKGGKARVANMTPEELSKAMRRAVKARWEKAAAAKAAKARWEKK